MIAFVSLFLGLVFGVQTVELVPGDGVTAVELRLDGQQVAMLKQAPWITEVSFGDELVPQQLEAIAYDASGRETGRAAQWLNLPTEGAALSVVLEPEEPGKPRVARLSWESTAGAEPQSVKASLDGRPLQVEDLRRLVLPQVDTSQLHLLSVEMRFEGAVSSRVDFTFGGAYTDQVNTEMTAVPVWSTGGKGALSVDKVQGWFRLDGKDLPVVAVEKGDAEVVMVMGRAFPRFLGPGERYKPPKNLKLPDGVKLRFLAPRPEQTQGVSTQFELFPVSPAYGGETGDLYELLAYLMQPPKTEKLQLGSAVAVAGLSAYESRKRRAVVLVPSSVEDSTVGLSAGKAQRYLERLGVPFYVWDPKGSLKLPGWGQIEKTSSLKALGKAFDDLRENLDSQWIVWLDGQVAPQQITLSTQAKGYTLDPQEVR